MGGYVGAVECVVLVNGELELGTDLKLARFKEVDLDSKTATLMLAEPKVRRARLDLDQSKVYRVDLKGLWKILPFTQSTSVSNQGMMESQHCVEAVGEDPELLNRAKTHTEQILTQFLSALGWEVSIEWVVGDQSVAKSS